MKHFAVKTFIQLLCLALELVETAVAKRPRCAVGLLTTMAASLHQKMCASETLLQRPSETLLQRLCFNLGNSRVLEHIDFGTRLIRHSSMGTLIPEGRGVLLACVAGDCTWGPFSRVCEKNMKEERTKRGLLGVS